MIGFQSIVSAVGVKSAVPPMMQHRLKTAEPTIVPMPTSFCTANTPISDVKSSGADEPAAMNVAPATSGESLSSSMISSSDGTK